MVWCGVCRVVWCPVVWCHGEAGDLWLNQSSIREVDRGLQKMLSRDLGGIIWGKGWDDETGF